MISALFLASGHNALQDINISQPPISLLIGIYTWKGKEVRRVINREGERQDAEHEANRESTEKMPCA